MIYLKLMQIYVPNFIKKRVLGELFRLTAEAFQCEQPNIKGLSYREGLLAYALFTKEQAEHYIRNELSTDEVKLSLSRNSYYFGRRLYKKLKIKDLKEAVKTLQIMYKLIGLEFECNEQGEFSVSRCYFRQYHTPEMCELMSSLDEGLAAGLTGGAILCIQQRVTRDGSCKGYFKNWRPIKR